MAIVKQVSNIGSLLQPAATAQQIQPAITAPKLQPTATGAQIQPASTQSASYLQPTSNADLLAQSTALAQNAAKLIGGTYTQGVGFTPNSTTQTPGSGPILSAKQQAEQMMKGGQGGSGVAVSTPATSKNPFSSAFSSLKSLLTKPLTSQSDQLAGTFSAFQPPAQTAATTTPALPTGVSTVQTTPTPTQAKSSITDQYQTITNDRTSDSATLQRNLETIKVQDQAEKQQQLQKLQSELAQKQAQLTALQTGQQLPENQPVVEGQPQQTFAYNPEGQSGISALSAQIRAMEEEIQRVQQDSPELQAATQALQKKIAEEAMIKANLNQGITNVQDQPIAQGFISGQSAALERQAEAKLQTNAAQRIPLQQQLANEQAKKQSAIDVVKSKYGNLQDARGRLEDIYKTNYQRANAVEDRNYKLKDEVKGTTTTTSGLNTGKTFVSGNLKYSKGDYDEDRNTLLSTTMRDAQGNPNRGADGYTNPSVYLDLYRQWIANGGLKSDFLQVYPVKDYINPANTWPEIVALGGGTKPVAPRTTSRSI